MAAKLSEFDVKTGNWKSYCERLEMHFLVNTVADTLKVLTLIASVGERTYELIVNLCSPVKPRDKKYEELVKILEDHLQPKPSILAERFRFRQCHQKREDTISCLRR